MKFSISKINKVSEYSNHTIFNVDFEIEYLGRKSTFNAIGKTSEEEKKVNLTGFSNEELRKKYVLDKELHDSIFSLINQISTKYLEDTGFYKLSK